MAKISANTITGGRFSRAGASYTDPRAGVIPNVSGALGSGLTAGIRPLQAEIENIDRLTRQKINNSRQRTREIQAGLKDFSIGLTSMADDIHKANEARDRLALQAEEVHEQALIKAKEAEERAMDKRAREDAEVYLAETELNLAKQYQSIMDTPVEGTLSADTNNQTESDAINGPYNAMSRFFDGLTESQGYTKQSARAKKYIDAGLLDMRTRNLTKAMEMHTAADRARRDANNALIIEGKKTAYRTNAKDITDANWDENLFTSMSEAVEKETAILAEKARLWHNGTPLEGSEEQVERIQQALWDNNINDVVNILSAEYVASEDESKREAIAQKVNALLLAKAGKAEDFVDGQIKKGLIEEKDRESALNRFNAAANGLPYSEDAAKAALATWNKAQEQRKTLEHKQRIELNRQTNDLFYELQKNPGNADIQRQYTSVFGSLPEADREAFRRSTIEPYEKAVVRDKYDNYAMKIRKATTPEEKMKLYELYKKEAKSINDKAQQDIALGILANEVGYEGRPSTGTASGAKYNAMQAVAYIKSEGYSGADAYKVLNQLAESGRLKTGAWSTAMGKLDEIEDLDIKYEKIKEELMVVNIDLGELLELDETGKPLRDGDGQLMVKNPNGTTAVRTEIVGRIEQPRLSRGGYVSDYNKYERTEIANAILVDLYTLAEEYMILKRKGIVNKSLGEYLKPRMLEYKETITNKDIQTTVGKMREHINIEYWENYLKYSTGNFNADETL